MQDNTAKWKLFEDGSVVYGPVGSGQNLNGDLQKNLGDELDALMDDLLGADGIMVGLQVQLTTGLAVEVTAGSGFVSGQRVRHTSIPLVVSTLPPNTTGIKIYVAAGTPFSLASRAWPASCGFTTGALGTDQLLLATVATDGSGVIAPIVDGRVFLSQLITGPTVAEKAALVGTGITAPSGGNRYVVNDDTRLTALVNFLATVVQIVTIDAVKTIVATHIFNPTAPGPPFILGANAQEQKVIGLNADTLDGQEGEAYHAAENLTGMLADGRLSVNIPRRDAANTFTTAQTIAPAMTTPPLVLGLNAQNQKVIGLDADRLDGQEGSFYLGAANLTGTLADARLSANVPRRDVPGTFTGKPNFNAGAEVGPGNEVWHEGNDSRLTVRVTHTGSQLITNDGLFHTITFNTIRYQRGSMYTTGSSIIIQRDGIHQVSVNLHFTTNATGTFRAFRVMLNGTVQIAPSQHVAVSAAGFCALNGSMPGNFVIGDFLQIQVAHDATSNLSIVPVFNTSPEFAVQWQGPAV